MTEPDSTKLNQPVQVVKQARHSTKRLDLAGQVFYKLTVVGLAPRKPGVRKILWYCSCQCGNTTIVSTGSLRGGSTRSCGCLMRQAAAKTGKIQGIKNKIHGQTDSPTWSSWKSMLFRCSNRKSKGSRYYVDRGISVCDRWLVYNNFVADMGNRPSLEHTLDRINNNNGYFPGNCRWSLPKDQCRNRRSNVILEHNGVRMCISAWTELKGYKRHVIKDRLADGWSVADAIETPVAKRVKKSANRPLLARQKLEAEVQGKPY